MENATVITDRRKALWSAYHIALEPLEKNGYLIRPTIPNGCQDNSHMYQILLPDLEKRTRFIQAMKQAGINCVFHYVPLHNAPYGLKASRSHGSLNNTSRIANCIVRLPLWIGLEGEQKYIINSMYNYFQNENSSTY